ncbi:MAG: ArsR family transcriptional regulator [Lachnospiraceae bacterium]|nr:ArsR family transcriptional regulator [Lachnospiraceae bacterium]
MLQERTLEYDYLQGFYNKDENRIVVVYGDRFSGIDHFLKDFIKDYDYFYYRARPCSMNEQLDLWKRELKEDLSRNPDMGHGYLGILSAMMQKKTEKRIVFIDEFQNIIKYSEDFMESLIRVSNDKWNNQPTLFILATRSVYWVENSMVEKLGKNAYEIHGLLKINDLKFLNLVRYFKKYKLKNHVEVYSILGGKRGLWDHFNDDRSVNDNICKNILTKGSFLYEYGMHILPEELREPNVYNTILSTLAQGREKLNDIYRHTGYSRAKISVYLKNLISLNIVEKVDSYDTLGRENAQKGIYRICDPFVDFWFCFVFSHLSKLDIYTPERFFTKYISPELKNYTAKYFKDVCSEYLELMNRAGQLRYNYTKKGSWIGKVGTIDIIAQDDAGHTIIGLCNWEKSRMLYEDYEWLVFCVRQARLSADDYYLFSANGFDEQLISEAENSDNIYLIDSDKL